MKVTVDLSESLVAWIQSVVAKGKLAHEKYNRSDFIRDCLMEKKLKEKTKKP